MEKIEINKPIKDEMSDLRREREILANESIEGKNVFAEVVRDRLGEEIRAQLVKKAENTKETPKKQSGLKNFLDKLSKICQ